MNQALSYVFVHGLSGWGSYDSQYRALPYWGMRGGDLMASLRSKGYACYAASVSPTGSAWDRACELYAQLAGTRTDYGRAHSAEYRHERFGPDFSERPLIPSWDAQTRLVLLGHSFGGVTVRLLAALLARGDAAEREAGGSDLSPLFAGGLGSRVCSVVTLAAPTNGTTAYELFLDPDFDPGRVPVPAWSRGLARLMSTGTKPRTDGRDPRDYADYDMEIDHALALNRRIGAEPEVYYFSVPCSFTEARPDGTHHPKRGMEPLFVMRSCQMGAYAGKTPAGVPLDEGWRENDGLVNTISARAPFGAASRDLDPASIAPGIWNVLPTYNGDHMALQGGLTHRHDVLDFYLALLKLIAAAAGGAFRDRFR
ncbi:MAG: hypothetical protein II062_04235 [Oscillospiraceae bacterium]|nr:hypothetical protein [Oscillospiraceae bacterium]